MNCFKKLLELRRLSVIIKFTTTLKKKHFGPENAPVRMHLRACKISNYLGETSQTN